MAASPNAAFPTTAPALIAAFLDPQCTNIYVLSNIDLAASQIAVPANNNKKLVVTATLSGGVGTLPFFSLGNNSALDIDLQSGTGNITATGSRTIASSGTGSRLNVTGAAQAFATPQLNQASTNTGFVGFTSSTVLLNALNGTFGGPLNALDASGVDLNTTNSNLTCNGAVITKCQESQITSTSGANPVQVNQNLGGSRINTNGPFRSNNLLFPLVGVNVTSQYNELNTPGINACKFTVNGAGSPNSVFTTNGISGVTLGGTGGNNPSLQVTPQSPSSAPQIPINALNVLGSTAHTYLQGVTRYNVNASAFGGNLEINASAVTHQVLDSVVGGALSAPVGAVNYGASRVGVPGLNSTNLFTNAPS